MGTPLPHLHGTKWPLSSAGGEAPRRPDASKQGTTILLASHNMNEVTRLCKKVLMMKDGIIIDKGNPEELINKHGRNNLEEVFLKLSRSVDELC